MTTGVPMAALCRNGHPVGVDSAFCSSCGAAVMPAYSLPSETWPVPASEPYAPQHQVSIADPYVASYSAPPTRRFRRKSVVIGLVLFIALAGGVTAALLVFGGSGGTTNKTVTGKFVLFDSDTASSHCAGQGGYSDIGPGLPVILTNQSGKILGSSELDEGVTTTGLGMCTYSFSIPDVPTDQDQYAVEVGHRGKVVSSKAEMITKKWTVLVSLGN